MKRRRPEILIPFRPDWTRERAELFLRERVISGKFHSWMSFPFSGETRLMGVLYPQFDTPPRL